MTKNNKNMFVYIGIPSGSGSVENEFFMSVLHLVQELWHRGIQNRVEVLPAGSYLPKMRDQIVARFMYQEHATHCLMLDTDIKFEPDDVLRLLKADVDFVCGIYTQKNDKLHFPVNWRANDEGNLVVDTEKELVGADGVPFGFVLLKRHVITKMWEAYPELKFTMEGDEVKKYEDYLYALFYPMLSARGTDVVRHFSEDLSFCNRWRDIGGDIWIDPHISLGHMGKKMYSKSPLRLLNEWAEESKSDLPCRAGRSGPDETFERNVA